MCLCSWACVIRQYGARVSLFGEPRFALVFTCMSYVHSYLKYPDVSWRAGGKVPSDRTQPRVCPQWRRCKAIHGGGIRENQTIQEQIRNIRSWIHTHTRKHTFIYTWHEVCVLIKYVCIHTHTHTHTHKLTNTHTHILTCIYVRRGARGWPVDLSHPFSQKHRTTSRTRREHASWQAFTASGRRALAVAPAWDYIYAHTHTHIHTYIHTYLEGWF